MLAVAVGIALLTAACGGNPSPTASGGSSQSASPSGSANAVAYSQCIRSHGVPKYPDPSSDGQVPKGNMPASAGGVSAVMVLRLHGHPEGVGHVPLPRRGEWRIAPLRGRRGAAWLAA